MIKTKEHQALEYQVGKLLANRYGTHELENLNLPRYCQDVIDCAIGVRMWHTEVWEWWNSLNTNSYIYSNSVMRDGERYDSVETVPE